MSNYILVGHLTLAAIEDGEYGTSEIDPLDSTIDALQEHLITGDSKKVPLLAYIGGLKATPPAAQRQWVGLTDEERQEIWKGRDPQHAGYVTALVEAKLKEKNT